MRILHGLIAAVLLFAAPAFAEPTTQVSTAFAQFEPLRVAVNGKVATVVMSQQRVTDTLYQNVITNGGCLRQIIDPDVLEGIEEIAVLNRHAAQGYIFEGGRERCAELNAMPLGKGKTILLMGYTRAH